MREGAGVEDGLDAVVDAASKAADGGGGIDEKREGDVIVPDIGNGVAVVIGEGVGEDGDDVSDGAEGDVVEFLGATANDLVLQVAYGF